LARERHSRYATAERCCRLLRPIDTGALERELNLKEVGSQRGMKELPDTTDDIFDAVEQTIVQRVVSEWTWQGEELINNLRAYAARLWPW
jgi:hypothetical protein